jgi:hypothetical protein
MPFLRAARAASGAFLGRPTRVQNQDLGGWRMVGGTQVVGNVGMYYAAYRLSRLGWNVMPTARNARGMDLLAYNANADYYLGIQVKALSKRKPVRLGKSVDTFMGDFWIIVTNAADDNPVCFIMKRAEVRNLAARSEKDGRVLYWLGPKRYDTEKFREAWHRIGRGDGS